MFDMDGNEASHGRDRVLPCLFFCGMDSLTEDTVNCGHPVPGCVFVEAEAGAGKQRRSTIGYHNT